MVNQKQASPIRKHLLIIITYAREGYLLCDRLSLTAKCAWCIRLLSYSKYVYCYNIITYNDFT